MSNASMLATLKSHNSQLLAVHNGNRVKTTPVQV